MFRLVKLAAYALLGYVLYELFLGVGEGEPDRQDGRGDGGGQARGGGQPQGAGARSRGQRGGGGRGGRRPGNETGGGATLSGPGQGREVPVRDGTGAEHAERVGRGVVSG